MKKLILFFVIATLVSCSRYYSPFEAASKGGLKCSKRNGIR